MRRFAEKKFNNENVVRRKNRKNNNKSGRPLVVNENPENQIIFLSKCTLSGSKSYNEALNDDSNKEDCIKS